LDTRYRARRRGGDGHRLPAAPGRAPACRDRRAGVHHDRTHDRGRGPAGRGRPVTEPGDGPAEAVPVPGEAVPVPGEAIRGPIDASRIPRYAGPPTFALLPWRGEVGRCDVVVAGVPFDSGTSYRPGARFGPSAVRQGSRLLRPWHPALGVSPLAGQQVADAGDIACNPFDIAEAMAQVETAAAGLLKGAGHLLA